RPEGSRLEPVRLPAPDASASPEALEALEPSELAPEGSGPAIAGAQAELEPIPAPDPERMREILQERRETTLQALGEREALLLEALEAAQEQGDPLGVERFERLLERVRWQASVVAGEEPVERAPAPIGGPRRR
ncbi:MAG: hypothetical protein OEY14_13600, partial [Myxococcales bacterium]|nr:hypothetical protein [Myxococcales bacterium]